MSNVNTATEVKRGRGRPKSFPNAATKMAGYNLPEATLEMVTTAAVTRGVPQNILVDRALRAYLNRTVKAKTK